MARSWNSKEVVAGFNVIEAPDLDVALAIARTNPIVDEGGGVEVLPVHSGGFNPTGWGAGDRSDGSCSECLTGHGDR
jgi:hypothetical protein